MIAGEVEIAPGPFHESNRTFGHGYASSPEDAAIKCLEAGLDLELTCCGEPTVRQQRLLCDCLTKCCMGTFGQCAQP